MDPFDELPPDLPTWQQEVDAVNAREELLLRARAVARRIAERFWKAMDSQALPGPHSPVTADPATQLPTDGQRRSIE